MTNQKGTPARLRSIFLLLILISALSKGCSLSENFFSFSAFFRCAFNAFCSVVWITMDMNAIKITSNVRRVKILSKLVDVKKFKTSTTMKTAATSKIKLPFQLETPSSGLITFFSCSSTQLTRLRIVSSDCFSCKRMKTWIYTQKRCLYQYLKFFVAAKLQKICKLMFLRLSISR